VACVSQRWGIVVMEVSARVRRGRQEHLIEQLQAIQKTEQHLFPGTMARYVVKGDEALTWIRCLLIWKSTDMPDEKTRQRTLEAFQHALDDDVDWQTAQSSVNEAVIHT